MNKNLIPTTDKEIKDLDLTAKQRAFLKLYLQTGNGVQSAMKVYDTDNYGTAGAIASENLKKLKEPVRTLMEAKGLSLGDLIETVQDARKANKIIVSHTEPDKEVADHAVRLKAVEIASKWLGVQPEQQITLNQQFNADSIQVIERFVKEENETTV